MQGGKGKRRERRVRRIGDRKTSERNVKLRAMKGRGNRQGIRRKGEREKA